MKVHQNCCFFFLSSFFTLYPSVTTEHGNWWQRTATDLESCWVHCIFVGILWEGGTELVLKDLKAERKWGRRGGSWAEVGQWIHQEIRYLYNSKRAVYFICKCIILRDSLKKSSHSSIRMLNDLVTCEAIQPWLWETFGIYYQTVDI